MKKPTTFTIEEDFSKRLSVVSKSLKLSKSYIVEALIAEMLPILEAETPNQVLANAFRRLSVVGSETASLFDDFDERARAFDDDVEQYKKQKKDGLE